LFLLKVPENIWGAFAKSGEGELTGGEQQIKVRTKKKK